MIEITTALVLLVTTLYGGVSNTAIAQDLSNNVNTHNDIAITKPVTLESYVRDYFIETPILAEIVRCESSFRQFDSEGKVLQGEVNKSDFGLLQVNEYYHGEKAADLGFDLKSIEGNLAYGQYLYNKEGTKPWNASRKCWKASLNK